MISPSLLQSLLAVRAMVDIEALGLHADLIGFGQSQIVFDEENTGLVTGHD